MPLNMKTAFKLWLALIIKIFGQIQLDIVCEYIFVISKVKDLISNNINFLRYNTLFPPISYPIKRFMLVYIAKNVFLMLFMKQKWLESWNIWLFMVFGVREYNSSIISMFRSQILAMLSKIIFYWFYLNNSTG